MGREHWVETTLGEIATHPQYGWTTKAGQSGEFKYFRTTDINSPISWESVPFCVEIPKNPEEYVIQKNDILVSRAGSVGLSIRFEEDHVDTLFASYLIRFKAIPPIDSKFIAYYLLTREYWDFIRESQSGIAVPNVNASKLSNLSIPLPPLKEQRRIVAKLDALLPKVKHVQTRLAKIPGIVKKFCQSVLAAACSGRLTEDWREGRDLPEWETKKFFDFFILQRGYALVLSKLENGNIPVVTSAGISGYHNKSIRPRCCDWKKWFCRKSLLY
ncbi:subunit S of type I restriction-modification system [Candidatus Vecturithrix granuli]|uniref:Subunit S of type I restriction-modification system n=1 Tax=Vecturithrix granuli TaxID=1499967 RepID=A0A081C5P0_VECG1|nr:subunit S of type I restriction-modification system [Candidatus Vecturithrix granuli]